MFKVIITLPNILSMARIALTPVFAWLFLGSLQSQIFSILIFTIAAITDTFDGYIARKHVSQTKFGAFIDPLADKILILSAFAIFAYQQTIGWWVVIIIGLRDLLTTQLRVSLLRDGKSLTTSYIAKLKTVFQFIGIYLLFLEAILQNIFGKNLTWKVDLLVQYYIYWLVFFSLYTCADYLIQYIKAMSKK